MVPHRRWTSALSAARFFGSGNFSSFGTLTHGCPPRVMIRTPPVVPAASAPFSLSSPDVIRSFKSAMNAAASAGLASAP